MPQTINSTGQVESEDRREESNCPTGSSQTGAAAGSTQHTRTNSAHTSVSVPDVPIATPSTPGPLSTGVRPTGLIKGSPSSYVASVVEWTFTESQSTIQGRTGSNACAFIALLMGKQWMEGHLLWPTGDIQAESWSTSLFEAMIKGNKIHDDLFNHQAVDFDVEDAVASANNECGVQSVGQQTDIFGVNPVHQLVNALIQEANASESCCVLTSENRTMLLAVNCDSSAMIIDSHSHGNDGAIIACSQAGCIHLLAQWLDAMMNDIWQKPLAVATITKIVYFLEHNYLWYC